MNENSTWAKIIKRSIILFILVLAMVLIGLVMLKYYVEGEQNMPFNLSEILVVSTAEGYSNQNIQENWNVEVYQTNDIYLNFDKNKNYKQTEVIKSIELKNITINSKPQTGKIEIYIPNGDEKTYQYQEEKRVKANLVFEGDTQSDLKNLKIANQGGTIIFRVVNKTGKEHTVSNNELKQDGTLLKQVGLTTEDIKTKISFDIVINLESDISFTGNVQLELPAEDIITQGISSMDRKNLKDIVFKRE